MNTTRPHNKYLIFLGTQFIDIAYDPFLTYTFEEQVKFTWVRFVALTSIQNF